jgi:predicted nucleic acid-binding protein
MEFLIYLDVCCLNRPFDDQTQERIRLETEAIGVILTRCQSGEWGLVTSKAIDDELNRISDNEKRYRTTLWVSCAIIKVALTEKIKSRAKELSALGFKNFDALHIACAEVANADILLTTDDRMLRLAVRLKDLLQVRIENPLLWLMEVTDDRCKQADSSTN